MTAELVLHFNNADDLTRVLQFLRETGLEILTIKPKPSRKKLPKTEKREWAFGIGNLGGQLDHVNLRDYAYED